MANKNIGSTFEKVIDTIDAFCDDGKKYLEKDNTALAVESFEYALSMAQIFAGEEKNIEIFEPIIARCLFYYSRAKMNDMMMWNSVLIALKYRGVDDFCTAIVEIGKKKFGFSDDTASLLLKHRNIYCDL